MTTAIRAALRPRWIVVLAAFLLLVVALRFAQPIQDGDIFWHMVYGSQMVDHGTLHVDHSLFSWMPASNELIYCAWTGELLFLAIWKAFGLAGLFALRYAAVLTVLALLAIYARRRGSLARPETWLVLLVSLLASVVATFPKPEMLSLVLWNALVFCWFRVLDAREQGRNVLSWIYAMPCIVLVWVNTHGAFVLATPFLAIVTATAFFILPRREARHMAIAAVLCGIATVVNPYGLGYPVQLLEATLGRTARPDIAWNNAFQSTFGAAGQYFHLPEFLVWMGVGLVAACVLVWKKRVETSLDPAGKSACATGRPAVYTTMVLLLFVAYVPLYVFYVRSTSLLPAIFGYGFLYLVRDVRWPRLAPALACVLVLFFGGRAVEQALQRPESGAWMGFGIGYSQPVDEAEFLARGNYGPRIYNTYNAGGYLMWRLFPRYQVMVDARSFPYVAWFDELKQFTRTESPNEFQAFLSRHPGDVALVDFQEDAVWRSFLNTPHWRAAFYGPAAAVFVHEGQVQGRVEAAASLQHLRNGRDGVRVFDFATAVGDYRTAWSLLDQMQGPLREQVDAADLDRMAQYRAGHEALRAGDYSRAWECYEASFRHHAFEGQDKTTLVLLRALLKVGTGDPRSATLRAGLSHLVAWE
jgi:hypothetical protein